MRLGAANKLEIATLTATNENLSFPIENIIDFYLELPFKATTDTSLITVITDDPCTVNYVAVGFHNISTMEMKFYNILDVLLETLNIPVEEDEFIYYFPSSIPDVKKIEITLTTGATILYVGGIFSCQYYEMPPLARDGLYNIDVRGSSNQSGGGQSSGNRLRALRTFGTFFPIVTNAERKELEEIIARIGIAKPIFLDLFPDEHDSFPVIYAKLIDPDFGISKRNDAGFAWRLNIKWKEAR